MITFQDFESAGDRAAFVFKAIDDHRGTAEYMTAIDADLYDRQKNRTINEYVRTILTLSGAPVENFYAANNKIASNFFRRLNTQRCTYSLGNGVSFDDMDIKKKLGDKFDTDLKHLAYKALIHGVAFGFWNLDRLYVFPLTEFVPIWDEMTGALRAGIRFWQLSASKPLIAVLYEEDGYTRYVKDKDGARIAVDKAPYKQYTKKAPVDETAVITGGENYSTLPIKPLWGSELHQSTLVGIQQAIDSYDLIRSGFANDLSDCAQIYWLVKNAGGMKEKDLAQFMERLKLSHIANVDSDDGGSVEPYTQEIPYQARQTYLDGIRAGIYEDFGGLDVHTVAAGATNDHIDAAYQPLDENADDFEYQIIEFVQQILTLMDIEAVPLFARNRISNVKEQVEIVMLESEYLDEETVLKHLPNITPDEIPEILKKRDAEEIERFNASPLNEDDDEQDGMEK